MFLTVTIVVGLILFISKGAKGHQSKPRFVCTMWAQTVIFIGIFVVLIAIPFIDIGQINLATTEFFEYVILSLIIASACLCSTVLV